MRQTRTTAALVCRSTAVLAWTIATFAATASAQGPDRDPGFAAATFVAHGIPEAARDAWAATVRLETRSWNGSQTPDVATGSGVIVDHDPDSRTIWIATSSHVVPCPGACLIRLSLARAGSDRGRVSTTAELAWRDPGRDLALLRATAPRKASFAVAITAEPPAVADAAGAAVVAIGFPDLRLLPAELRSGKSGQPEKLYSSGRLLESSAGLRAEYFSYGSARAEGWLEVDRILTHDADILPGSSGGPLIDAAGRVLGINTGSLTSRGAESCAERREQCQVHLALPMAELLEKARELAKHL